MLATVWPEYWHTLTARPAGGDDRHAQARELLAGHDITVPAAFTPAQMSQLAQASDARMALAARSAPDGEVIQFLAGAPELLARYRNAPPAAAALISAAMDARRLGMGAGLPQAFLEAAAPGYLTDAEWDALGEDWLEQALAYTAVPCKGARGPLTRIRPRPARPAARDRGDQPASMAAAAGPLYRLADYLDQHGRAHRASQIPPAEFWSAAAAHAAPGDQAALGDAAHARGLYRDAAQLHKNAAASGNPRAALYLSRVPGLPARGPPPRALGRRPRPPRQPARRGLPAGQPAGGGRARAGRRAGRPGRRPRPPRRPGRPWPACWTSLREAGADEQAAALLARDPAAHAALDDPDGRGLACWTACGRRARTSRPPRCWPATPPPTPPSTTRAAWPACWTACGRRARTSRPPRCWPATPPPTPPSTTRTGGVACLLDSLREAGADEQAAALAARAAAHAPLDDPGGVAGLLDSLREAGADEQAAALLAREPAAHAALDDPDGVAGLLGSLREAGAHEQAAALLARDPAAHAALDDPAPRRGLPAGHACGRRARTSRPPRWPPGPPPTPPSTTRAAWPACWTACERRARTSRPPRCWPATRPPTPPSTTRTAWPACWTACGGRARTSRPPRWPPGCRRPACSGSSSSSKALRISSVSDGRPTAPRPRHGAGKTWTYGLFSIRPRRRNRRVDLNNPPAPTVQVNFSKPS